MKPILNTCCMSLRDWYEMFHLALLCALCFLLASFMSALEYLSSWSLHRNHIFNYFFYFFFCIHCLSLSIANNSKWVFFIHRTLERRVKRMEKKHVSKLEAYARRQRDGKTLTDHQGNRRENCEGRIESRANYVLWTCLSGCLESSGKLLSLRWGALSGLCKTAQGASCSQCIVIPAASVWIFHMYSDISDRSHCLCASESACCLDVGDTTAPSTHKKDNAMQYRILFFFFFAGSSEHFVDR